MSNNSRYPKFVVADFRKIKSTTLKKYADLFDLQLRQDGTAGDMCAAVARHFDSHLDVYEDEVLERFVNAVRQVYLII
jgi:hypothetical protein